MLKLDQILQFRCFEGSFIIDTTATGAGDWITIPPDAARVSVQLNVLSTASVGVEATLSTIAEVEAATAIWKLWSQGDITGGDTAQDATLGPVTAIRCNTKVAKAGNNAFISIKTQGAKI